MRIASDSARVTRSMLAVSVTLALAVATEVDAQAARAPAGQRTAPPAGWTIRADAGAMAHDDGAQAKMEVMKPGWHVTTGPAAILFDSTVRASGNWRIEAVLDLFDPGTRAEGFGVFFGGRDLNGAAPRYSYALVRRDGRALLKVRDGATTRTVRDWTAHRAIPIWRSGPNVTSVAYPLVIEATADRVTMSIGGTAVLDAPRRELPSDGVIGLRVNHALSIHVEKLVVTPLTAR
jgi:hypothetical protein